MVGSTAIKNSSVISIGLLADSYTFEAATAFSDPNAIEFRDAKNSDKEDRWILVGLSARNNILLVVFVEREEKLIRIISARKAIKEEMNQYFSKVKS